LKKQFKQADKNDNGCLTLEECSNLIEQLNIKMPMKELKSLFKAANFSKAKPREKESLDEKEFVAFYYSLLKRPELDEVFIRFTSNTANDGPRMTAEGFAKFLKEEQKMEMATEECAQLIDAFEPTGDRTTLSIEGFTHFMMFSEWQEITDPSKKLVYQDMNQPLSHYWMASSHNT
jgi:Ca2+-binding EF-hand superfamily protein